MEAPARPVDAILLNEGEHIGRERVRIFLLVVGNEVHHTERRGTDFTKEDRILREHGKHAIPPLMPVIRVPGVHHAIPRWIGKFIRRFALVIRNAREIIRPEETACDNHILCARRAHGIHEGLHAN